MKPEVVIIRRADLMDTGFKKQEIVETPTLTKLTVPLTNQQSDKDSVKSIKSIGSRRSGVFMAPMNLTKEQFDIVNLNGDAPAPTSEYKLEQDPSPLPK